MNGAGANSGFRGVIVDVVLGQQIATEVAVEIPPYRVDVVGVVLGVIEFHDKSFSLNAVIVPTATVEPTIN